jgi:hypothetical protein
MSGGSIAGMPNQPIENNLVDYNKPLNLQGVLNESKMKEYHMRLNELLNFHKNHGSRPGDTTPQAETKLIWATSNIILMFLENVIKKYTRKPVFGEDNPTVPLNY